MGNKKDYLVPGPGDVGGSFEEADFILNYRPVIEFVEPQQEDPEPIEAVVESTIDDLRDRTQKLLNGLDAVSKLIDETQKRVDQRVAAGGGVTVKLDEKKDAATIAAMKRRFPDKADPTLLTYNDYKQALSCLQRSAVASPAVTAQDIKEAQDDPYRTNFGGAENIRGENRAEISSPASVIEPIDTQEFQKKAVVSLFKLMKPLISQADKSAVEQHKIDTPHG